MSIDLLIIGAGAAGLAAAIFAGEAAAGSGRSIVLVDGARKPGAKILISGGGRCNVTNEAVSEEDFWGGPRTVIRRVLRSFDERQTLHWMNSLGVVLKLEPSGKYFPVSDSARTVLEALLCRVRDVGVDLRPGARVEGFRPDPKGGFLVEFASGHAPISARRIIVATGGLSLPKSGSDGAGLAMLRRLGHSIVPATPALAPLLLESGPHPGGRFADFAGLTIPARLRLQISEGRLLFERTDSLLFTHFGLSGPAAMNLSRHVARYKLENPDARFEVVFGHPDLATPEDAERWIQKKAQSRPRQSASTAIGDLFPERLARALGEGLGPIGQVTRQQRLDLAKRLTRLPMPVTGDRGYAFAEATAGGVDLREVDPATMESRRVPGLYLCGEVLDVDGRIGGFNFQWAWSSGRLAGLGAANAAAE